MVTNYNKLLTLFEAQPLRKDNDFITEIRLLNTRFNIMHQYMTSIKLTLKKISGIAE